MRNAYDLKHNYILSNSIELRIDNQMQCKIAVFVHLFYEDSLDYYIKYINNIPLFMDIYISYSNQKVKESVISKVNRKIHFVYKENRGRDISSLLVAFRKIVLEYDYICFVHDKRAKELYTKDTVQEWIYSLWENMLSTEIFVQNIIITLNQNSKLGLLVPPSIVSLKSNMATKNIWGNNFNNCVMLANRLNLKCDLNENMTPITQGTCFWAKTAALRKLFEYEWTYEDFPDEPMPNDGTISHAIERILAYVAQDAGYETGWVMTDQYAGNYIDKLVNYLRISLEVFQKEFNLLDMYSVQNWEGDMNRLKDFTERYDIIYVYGIGKISNRIRYMLKRIAFTPTGYVVTRKKENENDIDGISIKELREITINKNTGFVMAVGRKNTLEIVVQLMSLGVKREQIYMLSSYADVLDY